MAIHEGSSRNESLIDLLEAFSIPLLRISEETAGVIPEGTLVGIPEWSTETNPWSDS